MCVSYSNVVGATCAGTTALALSLALFACAPGDPRVPWDTEQMARDIAQDLRRFERVRATFRHVEVLAWRIVQTRRPRRPPLDPIRSNAYEALVWVRVSADGAPAWLLVQADGNEEEPWRRVVINRELSAPRPHLRPGEDSSGTFHGFSQYATPPTSAQVCEFARVAFLNPHLSPDSYVIAAEWRRNAWRRVTGVDPACTLD